MQPYLVDEQNDILRVKMSGLCRGWERWFLLCSDWHWDNPDTSEKFLRRFLDQAKERDAGIIAIGDILCLMQGKNDRRHSKSKVKKEHMHDDYFDRIEEDTVELLSEYANHIVGIGTGNHETSVTRHAEINLISRIARRLKIPYLGYAGFVKFLIKRDAGGRTSRLMFYTHGAGGGGEVTRNVIDTNRKAVWLPDADIVVRGHVHEYWQLAIPRTRVSLGGKIYQDEQLHIQLPTMKQEHDLRGGFLIENGRGPKALGAVWLHFSYNYDSFGRLSVKAIRAD